MVYCRSEVNYTMVYYLDGDRRLLPYTLGLVSSKLGLIRVNRHISINKKAKVYEKVAKIGDLEFSFSRRAWAKFRSNGTE